MARLKIVVALLALLAFAWPGGFPSEGDGVVSGRVLSGEEPVVGATVRIQATEHAVATDTDGRFRLVLPGG